jgi:hypothetical protein
VTHRRPPAYPVQESVTFKKKLTYYLRSTGSFRNFLEAGFLSGIPNLPSAPPQPQPPAVLTIQTGQDYANAMDTWGDGMDAWRRDSEDELRYREHRFEVGLATAETRDFLSDLVLPVVLREDPRYVPGDIYSGLGARMGHALASIVVTKTDHGSLALNIPKLAGTVGAAFLAKEEYARLLGAPELNSGQFVERYIGYSLAGDLATNMGRELVRTAVRPDIERYNDRGMVSSDNYYPLSLGGTALYWVRSTWGLRNFVQGALIAGVPSIGTEPDQPVVPTITTQQQAMQEEEILVSYGQREQGWRDNLEDNVRYHERRLIGGFGESETQEFLANLAVPLATRMDPRYIAMGPDHSAGSRLENAFTGVVIGRTDSGHRMVNLPTLVGTVGAAFIAKESFYPKLGVPELESNRVLGKTIGFNLAGDALLNLFGEFFPHRGY